MNDELATFASERAEDGTLLIRLRGEIDLSNVEQLHEDITRATRDASHVVIELDAIDYIDSQGLRLLHRLSIQHAERGNTLELVAPTGSVARSILELTNMSDEFTLRDEAPR